MFASLNQWKEPEALIALATPLIGARPGSSEKMGTPIPIMEISSTTLRERLNKKLYCGHLIPSKVLDFIETNGVY